MSNSNSRFMCGITLVCNHKAVANAMLVGMIAVGSANQLFAQSGSANRGSTNRGSMTNGSVGKDRSMAAPAMKGYCPVCIIEMRKWVPGTQQHKVQFDGKTYAFPSAEQKKMFLANPVKYTPVLGGDCVVCAVDGNVRAPGSVHFAAIHKERLYLFPGEKEKAAFLANPSKYENADLAANGKCVVCRAEMQQDVPGTSEFSVLFNGKRYLFPGEKQKKMFVENPTKYAEKQMQ